MTRTARAGSKALGRLELIAVARELLRAEGLDTFSLRAVAKAAGFSPAGLYEYFPSKQALVDAVQDHVDGELAARLRDAADVAAPGAERVRAVLLTYIRFAVERRDEFLLLFARLGARVTRLEQEQHRPFQVLIDVVEEAMATGAVRKRPAMPTAGVAYGLWAAAHGMATLQATYLQRFEADFPAADAVLLQDFLRGLAA